VPGSLVLLLLVSLCPDLESVTQMPYCHDDVQRDDRRRRTATRTAIPPLAASPVVVCRPCRQIVSISWLN
jgi:hypothetical protein